MNELDDIHPEASTNATVKGPHGVIALLAASLFVTASFVIAAIVSSWLFATVAGALLLIAQAGIGGYRRFKGNRTEQTADVAAAFALTGTIASLVGIVAQVIQQGASLQ